MSKHPPEGLEEAILDAITRHCQDEDDREAALRYFKDILVSEMIDEAFE